jgi:hypothetical protein
MISHRLGPFTRLRWYVGYLFSKDVTRKKGRAGSVGGTGLAENVETSRQGRDKDVGLPPKRKLTERASTQNPANRYETVQKERKILLYGRIGRTVYDGVLGRAMRQVLYRCLRLWRGVSSGMVPTRIEKRTDLQDLFVRSV